jgi:hypothetical protein
MERGRIHEWRMQMAREGGEPLRREVEWTEDDGCQRFERVPKEVGGEKEPLSENVYPVLVLPSDEHRSAVDAATGMSIEAVQPILTDTEVDPEVRRLAYALLDHVLGRVPQSTPLTLNQIALSVLRCNQGEPARVMDDWLFVVANSLEVERYFEKDKKLSCHALDLIKPAIYFRGLLHGSAECWFASLSGPAPRKPIRVLMPLTDFPAFREHGPGLTATIGFVVEHWVPQQDVSRTARRERRLAFTLLDAVLVEADGEELNVGQVEDGVLLKAHGGREEGFVAPLSYRLERAVEWAGKFVRMMANTNLVRAEPSRPRLADKTTMLGLFDKARYALWHGGTLYFSVDTLSLERRSSAPLGFIEDMITLGKITRT